MDEAFPPEFWAELLAKPRDLPDDRDDRQRWNKIRQAWEQVKGPIMRGERVSPYWFDWDMTPIEHNVWCDIRYHGLPFYPQVPVGRFFVDFGDPVLKIAIEADGKQYHNHERDLARDHELWEEFGWRTYRATGAKTFRKDVPYPWDSDEWHHREHDRTAWHGRLREWGCADSQGLVWALDRLIYHQRDDDDFIPAIDILASYSNITYDRWWS